MEELRSAYLATLAQYLDDRTEATLHAAYETGRKAVQMQASVLELAAAHHEGLEAALTECTSQDAIVDRLKAAGDFYLESLSAFEIVSRGFAEAQERALLERRHSTMLRQLSTFLSDVSVVSASDEAIREILQLVTEQAREILEAHLCVAQAGLGEAPQIVAKTSSPSHAGWELPTLHDIEVWLESLPTRSVRISEAEFARHPLGRTLRETSSGGRPVRGLLAVPLSGRGGEKVGGVYVLDKETGDFSELDETVAVQLGQMASSAIERAQLYESDQRKQSILDAARPDAY